jgi:hypothetical protein
MVQRFPSKRHHGEMVRKTIEPANHPSNHKETQSRTVHLEQCSEVVYSTQMYKTAYSRLSGELGGEKGKGEGGGVYKENWHARIIQNVYFIQPRTKQKNKTDLFITYIIHTQLTSRQGLRKQSVIFVCTKDFVSNTGRWITSLATYDRAHEL